MKKIEVKVEKTTKGPRVYISRSNKDIVKKLFDKLSYDCFLYFKCWVKPLKYNDTIIVCCLKLDKFSANQSVYM